MLHYGWFPSNLKYKEDDLLSQSNRQEHMKKSSETSIYFFGSYH